MSKGETERFNIRLDVNTASYYKKKANEHGVSLSEYLRQLLVQGVITETVEEIEVRLKDIVAQIIPQPHTRMPDEISFTIFNIEALLTTIVQAKSIQHVYEAQDKAKEKMSQMKGQS